MIRTPRTLAATGVCLLGLLAPTGAHAASSYAPAAPVEVLATNSVASITLTWTESNTGSRAVAFRVYEGSTVVARNTTTHVTVDRLGFSTTHTYTVTAVDAEGNESPHSAPVTRRVWVGGAVPPCTSAVPSGLTVASLTSSAVSLGWTPSTTMSFVSGPVLVFDGADLVAQSAASGVHIGGLAPASTHLLQLGIQCGGQIVRGQTIRVTTPGGPSARPAAPTEFAVQTVSADSATLSWGATHGEDPTAGYIVYEGATPVAATTQTSVTVRGLYRDTSHQFTLVSRDAAGSESAAGPTASARIPTCEQSPPVPVVTAQATSMSTVQLSWVEDSAAISYTVYEGAVAVGTSAVPSAVVSGLASRSLHRFTVTATLTSGCGETGRGVAPVVRTPGGPPARPARPVNLVLASGRTIDTATGSVTFTWTQPQFGTSPVEYRLYEGATLVATSTVPTVTLRLPSAASHQYTVSAVDRAGAESAQSAPVTFSVPFNPIP